MRTGILPVLAPRIGLGQREVVFGRPAGGPGGEDDLAWHGLLAVPET